MFIVLCRFIGECIEERNDKTYDIYGILENKMFIQNKILYLVLKNAECGNSALQSWHGVCSIYGEYACNVWVQAGYNCSGAKSKEGQ